MAEAWILTRTWPGVRAGLGTVVRVSVGAEVGLSFVRRRACIVAILEVRWDEINERVS
jgi:hypothetical protein